MAQLVLNVPSLGTSLVLALNQATATLAEALGLTHEAQLVQLTTTSALGFTPTQVTLGGVLQTFQVGADGSVYVLAALTPYQTLTYTISG